MATAAIELHHITAGAPGPKADMIHAILTDDQGKFNTARDTHLAAKALAGRGFQEAAYAQVQSTPGQAQTRDGGLAVV